LIIIVERIASSSRRSPKPTERKFFWQDLSAIMMNMSLPWLLAGDWNATITSEDRKGGARGTRPSSSSFQNFVQMKGLIDLGYVGTNSTWRRGTRLARLDRALASDEWATLFPDSVIHHLPKLQLTGVSLSTLTYCEGFRCARINGGECAVRKAWPLRQLLNTIRSTAIS